MTGMERREFMELTGAAAVGAMSQLQFDTQETRGFDAYGLLIGPDGARPRRDGEYFREFDTFRFAYFSDDKQNQYWIDHTKDAWQRVGCLVQKDGSLYFRKQA